jgi:hypothetical protein
MTANDTVCPRLPEFGATGGATGGATKLFAVAPANAAASWVPVARIIGRSVGGEASRSSDGSESNAPYTSSNFGSVYVFIVRSMVECRIAA